MKIIETKNYKKIIFSGKKERGKRDGTGPFEGSAQDSVSDKGKRKEREEECPVKKKKAQVDPGNINPEINQPYSNYSSPSLQDNAPNEYFTEEHNSFPNKGKQYVSVYEVDREYGGPEEGGWWYDNYELVDTHPVATLEAARKVKEFLKNKLEAENKERGPLDSAKGFENLPEGTEDWQIPRGFSGSASKLVAIIEDEPGHHTTRGIPHYE